jgi:transcriptional regulator NrdR family protein
MPVPAWLKAVLALTRALGRLLLLLRRIPLVDDLCDRAERFLFNPVVVRLVRKPDDPDLDAALQLYDKRIPDEHRFQASDIIRWLNDDRRTRRKSKDLPTDWFLVAKYRRRVCGFMLFHYFPRTQMAFFAYMVIVNTPGIPLNAVSSSLCSMASRLLRTRRELKGCRTLLLEVDDPRTAKSVKRRDECLARVRRFCTLAEMQELSMRALDIEYRPPKISLRDELDPQPPLLLLFASPARQTRNEDVDRAEVERILSFVYMDLYPEGYSTVPSENDAYRQHCGFVRDQALRALRHPVRSLSCADLVSQVRNQRIEKAPSGAKTTRRTRSASPTAGAT